MLIGLFALVSCEPKNNEVEVASLQVAKSSLTFDKLGGDESIVITTNQANWTYYSAQEGQWITLSKEGANLKVKAMPNPDGKERMGVILVTAGGATERIEVSQIAADIVLDVNPGELIFPHKGGEMKISVASNTDKWEVAAVEDTDWLQLSKAGSIVFVNAKSNDTGAARQTRLLAKSGTKQVEIVVMQMAVEKYVLPLFEVEDPETIARREVARGGILTDFSYPSQSFFGASPGYVDVLPNTTLFNSFSYRFPFSAPKKWDQITAIATSWEELTDPKFIEVLQEAGFTQESENQSENMMTYLRADEKFRITLIKTTSQGRELVGLVIKRVYKQEKDYATFSSLPKPLHSYLENKKLKSTDVRKWAEERGYTVLMENKSSANKEQDYFIAFTKENPQGDEPDAIFSFYYADEKNKPVAEELAGVLRQYHVVYKKDVTRMMWNIEGTTSWRVTKEYANLVVKNGYPNLMQERVEDNQYLYGDGNGNYAMVAQARFSDLFDGADTVRTAYWYEADDEEGSSNPFIPTTKRDTKMMERAIDPLKGISKK